MEPTATIVIRAGREKSLKRRHPWIYSGAIERVDGQPEPGATVDAVDARGRFLARAAWSPASQIRARVWTFDPDEAVDEDFFARRLDAAVDARRRLGRLAADGACRLVFSESDALPGLIIDHYAGRLVCQFLSAGVEHNRNRLLAQLVERLRPRAVYERSEGTGRRREGLASRRALLTGTAEAADVEYRSAGLRRLLRPGHGQKTGAYLDQQDNARRTARYADGARVLDAFAYTGGFDAALWPAPPSTPGATRRSSSG